MANSRSGAQPTDIAAILYVDQLRDRALDGKVDVEGRATALARMDAGEPVATIARDFDVKPAAIYRWRREANA